MLYFLRCCSTSINIMISLAKLQPHNYHELLYFMKRAKKLYTLHFERNECNLCDVKCFLLCIQQNNLLCIKQNI